MELMTSTTCVDAETSSRVSKQPQTIGKRDSSEIAPIDINVCPVSLESGLQHDAVLSALAERSACTRKMFLRRAGHFLRIVATLTVLCAVALVFFATLIDEGKDAEYFPSKEGQTSAMSSLFLIGLTVVALEDVLGINKSAVMLGLATMIWTVLAVQYHPMNSSIGAHKLEKKLDEGLVEIGSVVLFLLPAMAVVESMDHLGGFTLITLAMRRCANRGSDSFLYAVTLTTFFLSSMIDNLTATIVALKILRHVVPDSHLERRHFCGGLVVVAANAGGAWSPVGDVTTTMLWVHGNISAKMIILRLFFPSFIAGIVPLVATSMYRCWQAKSAGGVRNMCSRSSSHVRDDVETMEMVGFSESEDKEASWFGIFALLLGVVCVLLVPVLKTFIGIPPYLGMLLGLAIFWLVSDAVLQLFGPAQNSKPSSGLKGARDFVEEELAQPAIVPSRQGVVAALPKVDLKGLLFFTGVLLCVGALNAAGALKDYADFLVVHFGSSPVKLASVLGVSSAVVDNVPLVQAAIDMFDDKPRDHILWHLIALASGTGGSLLSIGSVAGVTLMSMEGVGFLWYARHITPLATLSFSAGILAFSLQQLI